MSGEAGESNLRPAKHFAKVTSIVLYGSICNCRTHELYIELLHKGVIRRYCPLLPPKATLVIPKPCIFGAGTMCREGMLHVQALWQAIPTATLSMDKTTHQSEGGPIDLSCLCGKCAQELSSTRHSEPFDLSLFECWLPVPYTTKSTVTPKKDKKVAANPAFPHNHKVSSGGDVQRKRTEPHTHVPCCP